MGIGLSTENLAFGKAAITRTGDWSKRVPEVSQLERTLRRTVEGIRLEKEEQERTKDAAIASPGPFKGAASLMATASQKQPSGKFGQSPVNYSADLLEGTYKPKDVFRLYSWKLDNIDKKEMKKKSFQKDPQTAEKVASSKLDIEVSSIDI